MKEVNRNHPIFLVFRFLKLNITQLVIYDSFLINYSLTKVDHFLRFYLQVLHQF